MFPTSTTWVKKLFELIGRGREAYKRGNAGNNGSWILVEVKSLDRLVRYEEVDVRLAFVTNLRRGKSIEVWGIKELS